MSITQPEINEDGLDTIWLGRLEPGDKEVLQFSVRVQVKANVAISLSQHGFVGSKHTGPGTLFYWPSLKVVIMSIRT